MISSHPHIFIFASILYDTTIYTLHLLENLGKIMYAPCSPTIPLHKSLCLILCYQINQDNQEENEKGKGKERKKVSKSY